MKIGLLIRNNRIAISSFLPSPEDVETFVHTFEGPSGHNCPDEDLKRMQNEDYGDWLVPNYGHVQVMHVGYVRLEKIDNNSFRIKNELYVPKS